MANKTELRNLIETELQFLAVTHQRLSEVLAQLGLHADGEGTKRQRVVKAMAAIQDENLASLAESLLLGYCPSDAVRRNRLQDSLWGLRPGLQIAKRFRRELAQALHQEDLYIDGGGFGKLLDSLWVLDDDPVAAIFGGARSTSLRAQIERHVFRNPGDWTVEYLFDRLGAFDAPDQRFLKFLEGLASSEVRPEVDAQLRFVATVNESMRSCGVELREIGERDGYPEYRLVSLSFGHAGRPKNLIFASTEKPDIRIRDAVNNDLEILSGSDKVLVYDRPIGADGLRWDDLREWWADLTECADPQVAKQSLYRRLKSCLPKSSPPQRNFFDAYHRHFGRAGQTMPALLPEVWLHWDPKNVQQRGAEALLRFRMDFLLLLPNYSRVVIEIDGRHHYCDEVGVGSPDKYAAMMAADRELRFAGYDVYRFGARELSGDQHEGMLAAFFEALFKRNHVGIP